MEPRRNEEAQAHIRLSSHTKKKGGGQDILSLLKNVQTPSGAHPASYSVYTSVPSRDKSCWDVMWSLTTIYYRDKESVEPCIHSPIRLRGVRRDNFTFYLSCIDYAPGNCSHSLRSLSMLTLGSYFDMLSEGWPRHDRTFCDSAVLSVRP
jgi:hypothetical protein